MLFIFDENFPPEFVRGFSIIEKANKTSSFPVEIIFSTDLMGKQGSSDEILIARAAKKNAVIVTQDNNFRVYQLDCSYSKVNRTCQSNLSFTFYGTTILFRFAFGVPGK